MKNLSFIAMVLVLPILCSCKSEKNKSLSNMGNPTEVAKVAVTNWIVANGIDLRTNKQLAKALETFPDAFNMSMTNDVTAESVIAAGVMQQMWDKELLPGVSKEQHGTMNLDPIPSVISNKAVTMTFPASRTFHFVKDGETFTNNYTLIKQTENSDWKLQRAWEVDSNGQTIQEWPVK
jgi:hypothetical protein